MDSQKIKKENARIKKRVKIVLFIYILFFTSKWWYPASDEYIEATPYFAQQKYEDYSICVESWEYCEEQKRMKIILQMKNSGITDIDFTYQAVERTYGDILTEVVLEEQEFTVLHLLDVTPKWKEISLRIIDENAENGTEPLRLYTNKGNVKTVERIDSGTVLDYRFEHANLQIEYCEQQISNKEKEIEELTGKNAEIAERIAELQESIEEVQLLDAEREELNNTIEQAQSAIDSNMDRIEAINEEISLLETKILYLGEEALKQAGGEKK